MPFQPGNQEAKKGKPAKDFAAALRIAIKEAHGEGSTKLRAVADALVDKAISGDVPAIKEIADRLDGKVPQAVVGDEDESPVNLVHVIKRVIVDASRTDNPDG